MSGLPAPGAVWAGLRIETQLGPGGAITVHSARDVASGRRVVLRTVDPELDAAVTDRFLQQWRTVAGLGHPRIVPVLGWGRAEGVGFVVTEYVDGTDLAGEIGQSPLALGRAVSVIAQVAGALDRAHRAGLVHGRLEAGDVLCAMGSGDVALTGFGGWDTPPAPHHRPPGAGPDDEPSEAEDLYALGCLLYESLTGRLPFRGSPDEVTRLHREAPRPAVTDLRPDLPAAMDVVVATAMAVDPTARYATARALADALRAAETAPVVARPGATREHDLRRTSTVPVVAAPSVFEEATLATAVVAGGDRRRVVDGAVYGVYEDDEPRSRAPAIAVAVVGVLALVVGALVWRAVNTDAELVLPATTTTTAAPSAPAAPTVEDLQLLVPPGVDGCRPPDRQPADDPTRVELRCTPDDGPRTTTLVLYSTLDDRDAAFDAAVTRLDVSPGGECALGGPAVHDFIGVVRVGRVACRSSADGVEFVWTSDEAPLLLNAAGPGSFAEHYRSWAATVDRIDAAFPLPVEQRLLERLPGRLLDDCERDLDLLVEAAGEAAARCRPEGVAAEVSWVQFPDAPGAAGWIDGRRAARDGNVFADRDDACTPRGFGRRRPQPATTTTAPAPTTPGDGQAAPTTSTTQPPRPDAGFTPYDLGGRTGTVLCFVGPQRRSTVIWVRDGSRIGSVAVAAPDRTMADLLRWWRDGGHLP